MIRMIADIGATNSRWLVEQNGHVTRYDQSGYNAATHDPAIWDALLRGLNLDPKQPVEAHLYGAGFTSAYVSKIESGFRAVFPNSTELTVATDLLGACRGMAQHQEAIISILGTGSNSAHFKADGTFYNIVSGGFLLGDEGAATQIGKAVIQNFIRHQMPEHLAQDFKARYPQQDYDALVATIYAPQGIVYLGQFAKFAHAHLDDVWMNALVTRVLSEFIDVLALYQKPDLPHYFSGSVAVHFASVLTPLCRRAGINDMHIIPDYLDGIARYHHISSYQIPLASASQTA